ncbi:SGNH/GDSL hydrolase family protein [Rhodopirellula sp. JC740]|uniref:SGNH/GDSL hydrolase family protein n=1 Tax=Rhodopirellula halodulae TaxID=2894198 RepID=A0ABS8NG54_9BACT|nr:SGNH/GDSL hydrolase family protein [Rhodopirellula sp. JC740]MCC9641932.1 SGNH/GDSL hydrolase family protein [Rhodopirellula sp. JC740]
MTTTSMLRKPRTWLFIIATVVFVGVPAYIEFKLRRPVGEGPAGPSVAREPFDEVWTSRQVHLLGIGDSVTRGLGAKSKKHSYFERLRQNPEDEFEGMKGKHLSAVLPNLQATNVAVSGSTSLDHERVVFEELTPFAEDEFGLVVMTTGGNDLIHSYGRRPPKEGAMYGATLEQAQPWIEAFEDRLQRMVTRITELFPGGCLIFVGDIYDPTDGVGDAPSIFLPDWPDGLAIHAQYNQVIRRVAGTHDHVHVVPLHETFLGHGSHCRQFWRSHYDSADPTYWFYSNIEDPNDRGYDAIRRVFLNEIITQRDAFR